MTSKPTPADQDTITSDILVIGVGMAGTDPRCFSTTPLAVNRSRCPRAEDVTRARGETRSQSSMHAEIHSGLVLRNPIAAHERGPLAG